MTQEHPITPPPELVQEWIKDADHNKPMFAQVAVTAARWGADQELEACCEWVSQFDYDDYSYGDRLQAARRSPKPPSLKPSRPTHYLPMPDILDDSYESDLTEEEHEQLILMSEHAIAPPLIEQCLVAACLEAYWNNERFGNSLLGAPERMQAVFDVLAEWCDQLCYSDTAQRLRDASGRVDG